MGLDRYNKKRDFSKTPEPKGKRGQRSSRLSFVVQKHAASRLHYDFRLELDGVLKSWAVPKGPSLDPSQKRLAVQVEDHPMDYAGFEGVIPAGQYGGGTVMVWDRGTWTAEEDPERGLKKGSLKFKLDGKKLKGSWALVRIRARDGQDDKNWLLIKHADAHAKPEAKYDLTRDRPESVVSGRDLDEIAAKSKKVWNSDRAAATDGKAKPARKVAKSSGKSTIKARPKAARTARSTAAAGKPNSRKAKSAKRSEPRVDPAVIDGARRAALPDMVEPQLATLVRDAPRGEEWLHEIKFDGYRALCRISKGRARWLTRNGNDWTPKFASLAPAVLSLPVDQALLDGEVVVLRPDGTTSFQDLQNAFRGEKKELTYCAFDLLHLDGFDLRAAPLRSRKAALEQLLRGNADERSLRYSDHVLGSGEKMYGSACQHHLEGIISKRADEPYRSGRGTGWLKVKCSLQQEFVIGGFSAPQGSRQEFGALLLGYYDGARLHYAGRVGTGFDDALLKSMGKKLRALERDEPAFVEPPTGVEARGVRWIDPKLVAEIQFTGWTGDGRLRHPSFLGLREDKPARQVVREKPAAVPAASGRKQAVKARSVASHSIRARSKTPAKGATQSTKRVSSAKSGDAEVAGVRISHPERVVYPGAGITKLELATFYENIGEWILPHVIDRPLNVLRCPEGSAKPCFFQRHGHTTFSAPVKSVDLGEGGKGIAVDSVAGLVTLVQMGVLELHPWGSKIDLLDRPDRVFFDLDPDAAVPWKRVVETAKLVRAMLEELGLKSFVKTTGGKGLHVVVPIARRTSWDDVKEFSRGVADQLVRAAPDLYIATASKARRTKKIFIDYLRNARSASAVAAYSTRAREGAPVSVPITWEEIDRVRNEDFHVGNVAARVKQLKKDPWSGLLDLKQAIDATAMKSVARK